MQLLVRSFVIVERILRDRTGHFKEIGQDQDLIPKILEMLVVTLLGLGVFGAAMGLTSGLPWALTSSIKLPLVFCASLLICLPTLYYFSLLVGGHLTLLQTIAVILTALTVTAVLSLGFALISLFFHFTGSEYAFMVTLNVVMLAVSGGAGLLFLVQGALYMEQTAPPSHVSFSAWLGFFLTGGARSAVLVGWIFIFGVIGLQMGWALRPFLGAPGSDFALMRPAEGSFYQSFLGVVEQMLTGG
jgi:hypothetical protein